MVGGFHTTSFSEKLSFVVRVFLYRTCYIEHVFLVPGHHILHTLQLIHIYESQQQHRSIRASWEFKALWADNLYAHAPFLKPALTPICFQDKLMWGIIKELTKQEEGLAQLVYGANKMPGARTLLCTPSTDSSFVGYITLLENSGKKR